MIVEIDKALVESAAGLANDIMSATRSPILGMFAAILAARLLAQHLDDNQALRTSAEEIYDDVCKYCRDLKDLGIATNPEKLQ